VSEYRYESNYVRPTAFSADPKYSFDSKYAKDKKGKKASKKEGDRMTESYNS
jgi:hypothetical protein